MNLYNESIRIHIRNPLFYERHHFITLITLRSFEYSTYNLNLS